MNMVTTYVIALVLFVGLDLVWLGYVARGFYQAEIGALFAEKMNLPAAAAFYLIYTVGLMVFVLQPSLLQGGWMRALMLGALFGFVAYSTYDLSNLATLRGWTTKLSIVDMVWGATLTGVTSALTVILAARFAPSV
jgi:uncharacterized membrane protein